MNYYIIVASKDHVATGVEKGFAQAGHGKKTQLDKLPPEDWVIYYSSKETYSEAKPYQKFTAIGQVSDAESFQVTVNEDFKPWRRKVRFYEVQEVEIRPLLDILAFIQNKKKWGMYLMSGFVQLNEADFRRIAEKMLVHKKI